MKQVMCKWGLVDLSCTIVPEERLYIKGKENVTLTRYNVLVLDNTGCEKLRVCAYGCLKFKGQWSI